MRLSLIRLLPRVRTHHQIHDDTHAAIACDMLNPAQCPEHALMARIPLGLGPSLVAQSHTPRNRCVRFVFGVTAASRNTRFQATCWTLPGPDLHRLIAPALLGAFLHNDRPSVRASWRARHGRSSGDQTAELKNSKSAKCRALRHKLESPSSLYARRHSRDSGIATIRPLIGDSIMTVLLKYLAVLGFAGALSLATTTAFAQNVSGSVCGENSNGVYYC